MHRTPAGPYARRFRGFRGFHEFRAFGAFGRFRGFRQRLADDTGATIPLILGFFLIALLFVGGTVALSDAVTRQRELQSTCDGAAIAAANSASRASLHDSGAPSGAIPLDDADNAIEAYLQRDPALSAVRASGSVSQDGTRVVLTCTQRGKIAFGALIGKPDGIQQSATSAARSPLTP